MACAPCGRALQRWLTVHLWSRPRSTGFQLLKQAIAILKPLPTLIDIPLEDGQHITVCGDTHGQFYDLLNIFKINGMPSPTNPYVRARPARRNHQARRNRWVQPNPLERGRTAGPAAVQRRLC